MKAAIAIAIGGALGALSRFWVNSILQKLIAETTFPWGTFSVNIVGAFALGVVLTAFTNRPITVAAIGTGFLGSFTTFSTFSYETVVLFREGFIATAMMYIALSLSVSIIGVLAGIWAGSHL